MLNTSRHHKSIIDGLTMVHSLDLILDDTAQGDDMENVDGYHATLTEPQ
jgi:hypothetical protein